MYHPINSDKVFPIRHFFQLELKKSIKKDNAVGIRCLHICLIIRLLVR